MQAYLAYRDRVFLPVRPLDYYLALPGAAGFIVEAVTERTIEAGVDDWFEFLSAYHDAVLGWVGGSAKVDGAAPSRGSGGRPARPDPPRDGHAVRRSRPSFRCCWTYINCVRP